MGRLNVRRPGGSGNNELKIGENVKSQNLSTTLFSGSDECASVMYAGVLGEGLLAE
jgi:hypothetical protein